MEKQAINFQKIVQNALSCTHDHYLLCFANVSGVNPEAIFHFIGCDEGIPLLCKLGCLWPCVWQEFDCSLS